MTPADAMAKLDGIVEMHDPSDHYRVANVLYEASLRGLLAADIPARTMYQWVVKWAQLPGTRGVREESAGQNVIDLFGWLEAKVDELPISRS